MSNNENRPPVPRMDDAQGVKSPVPMSLDFLSVDRARTPETVIGQNAQHSVGKESDLSKQNIGIRNNNPLNVFTRLSESNPWVALAADVIATSVAATVPLFSLDSENKSDEKALKLIKSKLLMPNLHQTGYELIYATAFNLALYGTAFWHIVKNRKGEIHSIYNIPPQTMTAFPYYDNQNIIHVAYIQDIFGSASKVTNDNVFLENEIVPFVMPNQNNIMFGKSAFYPLLREIATDLNASNAIAKFLEQGLVGGSIFRMDGVDVDVIERNKQWIREEYTGAENYGKPILLMGDIEIIDDGNKFGKGTLSYEAIRKISKEHILSAAGVPLSQAGVRTDNGQANIEVIQAEEQAFLRNTVEKYQQVIYGKGTMRFIRHIMGFAKACIEAGTNRRFNIKDAAEALKAVATIGVQVNEGRALLGMPKAPAREAGEKWIIATNNGSVPAELIMGVDYNTGEEKESLLLEPPQFTNPSGGALDVPTKAAKAVDAVK